MNIVIFGGTGDLAYKKLFPAIYQLYKKQIPAEDMHIYGIGSRPLSDDEYKRRIAENIGLYVKDPEQAYTWAANKAEIRYIQGDVSLPETYRLLSGYISQADGSIFYLAVMPEYFGNIADGLLQEGLNKSGKIAVEKPLGWDLETSEAVNDALARAFPEKEIYRIDHYLGKEMTGNILVLRFANGLFDPLLNDRHIGRIRIYINEESGVLNRGRYYDRAGAIRDMVQNHILQLLCLAVMEKPASLLPEHVSAEKIKVLEALRFSGARDLVLGQYEGYCSESGVSEDSNTETFAALKVNMGNARWSDTCIYLQTGKMLDEKSAHIEYEFRKGAVNIFGDSLRNNKLSIRIQPEEGVSMDLNVIMPGSPNEIANAEMKYCQPCSYGINSREAYEKLLHDMIAGDKASFTSREEVRQSWIFTDKVMKTADTYRKELLQIYEQGGKGPDTGKIVP